MYIFCNVSMILEGFMIEISESEKLMFNRDIICRFNSNLFKPTKQRELILLA